MYVLLVIFRRVTHCVGVGGVGADVEVHEGGVVGGSETFIVIILRSTASQGGTAVDDGRVVVGLKFLEESRSNIIHHKLHLLLKMHTT